MLLATPVASVRSQSTSAPEEKKLFEDSSFHPKRPIRQSRRTIVVQNVEEWASKYLVLPGKRHQQSTFPCDPKRFGKELQACSCNVRRYVNVRKVLLSSN